MKNIILLVLLSLFVYGCGSGNSSSGSNTLTLWMPPYGTEDTLDKNFWEELVKPFEEENNVKINVEIISWANYEEKYLTGVSSGRGPDVGYMYNEMIADFLDLGAIYPIDEYLTEADKTNYLYLEDAKINGELYGLPIVVGNARIIVYNKTLLDKEGVKPPVTWQDFIDANVKLTKDTNGDGVIDQFGTIMIMGGGHFGNMNGYLTPFLWQAGGDFFTEDGKIAFDSPEALKTIQFLYDLKFKYKVLHESTMSIVGNGELFDVFNKGNVAFATTETRSTSQFLNNVDFEWGFIVSLKDKQQKTFTAMDQLVLMSKDKKDLSYKLMHYLTSAASMEKFHTDLAKFPPISKEEKYLDDPLYQELYTTQIDILKTLPKVKGATVVFDALTKNIQSMMLGEKTPEQVIKESAEYGRQVLENN